MIPPALNHYWDFPNKLTDREVFLRAAYARRKNFMVHVLDCSVSFQRQPTDMSFEEVMANHFGPGVHLFCCHRTRLNEYEIGFTTMTSVSHFLYLFLEPVDGDALVEEFGLARHSTSS